MKNIYGIIFSLMSVAGKAMSAFYFFAAAALGMAADTAPFTNAEPVLLVNREPVSAEEFGWFMQQERAGVFQFAKAKFNLDYGTNFWDRELPGGTPRTLLRQRTVDRITREKVQQIRFRDLGLVDDIRYASFVQNLDRLNAGRESAAKLGQPIYGPVRYTQLQYYGHWMAGLRIRAIEQLAESKGDVSDGPVKDFYQRNREMFQIEGTATLESVTLQGRTGGMEKNKKMLQEAAQKIIAAAKTGSDLKTLVQGYAGNIKVAWQRFEEMNEDRIGELLSDEKPADGFLKLTPGQGLPVVVSENEVRVYICLSNTPAHYPAFEEIKDRARSSYLDQLYDHAIDDLVKHARVQLMPMAVELPVQ